MKKFIGYAILALALAGMVFLLISNKKKISEETAAVAVYSDVKVDTLAVTLEKFSMEVSANGLTAPIRELKFVSDVSGRVTKILVDKGSRVRKGSVLLEIDKEMLQADYESAKTAYESMQKNVERLASSNEVGGVSDQQLESLQAQLVAAKSRYDVSRRRLSDANVKSPMDGIIDMRYVETGSLIAPSAPLFDIVDNSKLKLVCNLPEKKLGYVFKGQKVCLAKTGSDKEYYGKVNFVGVKSDRGLNYPVEIILDADQELRPGMYLKASFISEDTHSGILVPRSAIVGGVRSAMVYLYKDGKAVEQDITIGEMIGDKVEILSGLKEGDVIVVSGLMNVSDGIAVEPIN